MLNFSSGADVTGIYHLWLQTALMEIRRPGEHAELLPLLRWDAVTCVEVKAAGL